MFGKAHCHSKMLGGQKPDDTANNGGCGVGRCNCQSQWHPDPKIRGSWMCTLPPTPAPTSKPTPSPTAVPTMMPTPAPTPLSTLSPACHRCLQTMDGEALGISCLVIGMGGIEQCHQVDEDGRCPDEATTCRKFEGFDSVAELRRRGKMDKCVKLSLTGDPVVVTHEGFPYMDSGVTAKDPHDGDVSARVVAWGNTVNYLHSFEEQGSCAEVKATARTEGQRVGTGYYYITAKEQSTVSTGKKKWKKKKLKVWCDMESDGGIGYTMLPIANGVLTSKYTDPTSCARFGMQMVVPRSKAHFEAMLVAFGHKYFKVVPGVYGAKAGDYRRFSMNSNTKQVSGNWKAIDGGSWWLRDTPYAKPSGHYLPGCWLPMRGWDVRAGLKFEDDYCDHSFTDDYICSPNDVGGPGVDLREMGLGRKNQLERKVGAQPGRYTIRYHVQDAEGHRECEPLERVVIVKPRKGGLHDQSRRRLGAGVAGDEADAVQVEAGTVKDEDEKGALVEDVETVLDGDSAGWREGESERDSRRRLADDFSSRAHPSNFKSFDSFLALPVMLLCASFIFVVVTRLHRVA